MHIYICIGTQESVLNIEVFAFQGVHIIGVLGSCSSHNYLLIISGQVACRGGGERNKILSLFFPCEQIHLCTKFWKRWSSFFHVLTLFICHPPENTRVDTIKTLGTRGEEESRGKTKESYHSCISAGL